MNPLNHVAIIMDGNGRWGLKYKNSRNEGHKAGLRTIEKIIKESIKNNIKFLTLFAFSTENWKRPKNEVTYLFSLLERKFSNKLNKKLISFLGLFQFSVEKANKVKNFILFLIVSLIIFSTVFKPALCPTFLDFLCFNPHRPLPSMMMAT